MECADRIVKPLSDFNGSLVSFSRDLEQCFQSCSIISTNERKQKSTESHDSHIPENQQEDEDEENLSTTGANNSTTLLALRERYPSISEFLKDDDIRITAHPISVSRTEQETLLDFTLDIDGVVIEMNSFSAIKLPLPYVMFPAPTKVQMKPMFHLLKKHFTAGHYKKAQFKLFKDCKGIILSYEQGWQLCVALVPDEKDPSHRHLDKLEDATLSYFIHLNQSLCGLLRALPEEELFRPTVRKNRLYDLSRFNILPQDQDFVLRLFDRALSSVSPLQGLKPLIFMCKFGQKQSLPLALREICFISDVKAISVHSACNVISKNRNVSLFWSKYALHSMAGRLGTMTNVLTLREAVNFQSNLDGQQMTVDRQILNIAKFPCNVTFIQFYADTPHNRLEQYRPHPISGEIVCCGLLHHMTNRAMSRNCVDYIQHMQELVSKLRVVPHARVELVTVLEPTKCGDQISPEDMLNVEALKSLTCSQPMLVPFAEIAPVPEKSFLSLIREVATHLIDTLRTARSSACGQGKFLESWTAFQAEMALEVFFWGCTMNPAESLLAINLGVATQNERSLTWLRGFLGLEPANSSTSQNEPPPISNWTKKDKQVDRICRLYGFADSLEASYSVLGKQLIQLIVRDLYGSSKVDLFMLSHNAPPTGKCISLVSVEHLASMLEMSSQFVYPYTFQKAASMMSQKGLPLKEVLQAGLRASGIKYFPAWQSTDQNKEQQNPSKLRWNRKHFWHIAVAEQAPPLEALAGIISNDVAATLKNSSLTYDKNIVPLQEHGMPWVLPALERIKGAEQMSRNDLTQVVTFLSCLALLQQGVYVDFRGLAKLEQDLPLKQASLRSMQVLDSHLFPKFNIVKLYKLHPDIPFKVITPLQKPAVPQNRRPTDQAKVLSDEEEEEEELGKPEEEEQNLAQSAPMVVPAGVRMKWTARELSFVEVAFQKAPNSILESYAIYQKVCLSEQVPVRTFIAYKRKLLRMRK